MIDLEKLEKSGFLAVDGELKDGRVVEFKKRLAGKLEDIVRLVVAMANNRGGKVIWGVDDNGRVLGVDYEYEDVKKRLSEAINNLSVGVKYELTNETIEKKRVVVLDIEKSESTAFFSRVKTSPELRIAYRLGGREKNKTIVSGRSLKYSKVYKYMTLDAFLMSLYTGKWRFFEPSKWNDKCEQRFYCARYELTGGEECAPQLFATCVTRLENSEAAWKVYSHGQGMGAHCVQLEVDIVELRKQIERSGLRYEERPIVYQDEKYIMNLHKENHPDYAAYFKSFSLEKFLDLLSLKRNAYEYEKEIRLFFIPKTQGERHGHKKAEYRDIDVEWRSLIKEVRVDKKCTDAELMALQCACHYAGISPVISKYNFPVELDKQENLEEVKFIRFDIDSMPSAKVITIN